MNLYDIQRQVHQIMVEVEDNEGEISPELEVKLQELELTESDKVDNLISATRYYESLARSAKVEIDHFNAMKKRSEKAVESIEKYLLTSLGHNAVRQTRFGKLSFGESERCKCVDLDLVPEVFRRHKSSWEPNVTEAKKALKEGGEAPGFEIEKHYSLKVK